MTAKIIDITVRLAARAATRGATVANEAPKAPAFVPAYCDPSNERRGPKYSERLSTKEIAARVRAEVKEAQKAGRIAAGVKVSVRYESFSGGTAIRVNVTAVPAGFVITNPAHARAEILAPHDYDATRGIPRHTPEAAALLEELNAIVGAYHRDNSDSSVDYFDVNFYGGDAGFHWELEREDRKAVEATVLAHLVG